MVAVPVDRTLESGAKIGGRLEAELLPGSGHVEHTARLAVGLGRIEDEATGESAEFSDELRKVSNANLESRTDVDRLRRIVALRGQHDGLRTVLDEQKLARRVAGAPALYFWLTAFDRLDAFPDECGNHVRRPRVEIVVRSVEIDRQQMNGVEAVLLAIGLPLHQQHLLGDAVRGVGLFWIAVPQVLLVKRHRGELWVRANRADADEFLHAGASRLLHDERAEHDVFEEEAPGRFAVRADPAHHGSQVNHQLRPQIGVHPLRVGFARQVVLRFARRRDGAAAGPQGRHDVTAKESAAAGDDHTLGGESEHQVPTTARSSTWRPMTITSMCVRRKQSSACPGVSTIGSFSLNDVLSTIGTPVIRSNDLIRW